MSAKKKAVPFEQDYRHWKDLYEMGERRHKTEIEKWQQTANALQQHALTLGAVIVRLLNPGR